jgi:hypothetical protein
MTTSPIAKVARLARAGTLEVEQLLHAATKPTPDLADALDQLTAEMDWQAHPCFPQVPLATWAAIVSHYCRHGHAGLVQAAHDPDMLPFALGLLAAIRTDEALETVIRIAGNDAIVGLATPEQTAQIVDALNLAAMKARRLPAEADCATARDFLHSAWARAVHEEEWGTLLCALRYFGDETSLALIAACPPLPPHWEAARKEAVRSIRKAMKASRPSR